MPLIFLLPPLLFAVPGPPSLQLRLRSGPSVEVWWTPPLESFESGSNSRRLPVEIQGYRLQFGLKNSALYTTIEFGNREKNFTVKTLSPGSTYVFVLSAKSKAGYGDVAQQEITVPIYPPMGYPEISDIVNVTCCSVQFSWLPLTSKESNSPITGHTVAYKQVTDPKPSTDPAASTSSSLSIPPWIVSLPANDFSCIIQGLNHSTAYELQLRAHNKAGPGPFSPPLVFQTLAFETGRAGLGPWKLPLAVEHRFSFTSLLPLLWNSLQITKLNQVWTSSCRSAFHPCTTVKQSKWQNWVNHNYYPQSPPFTHLYLHHLPFHQEWKQAERSGCLLWVHCLSQTLR